MNKITAIFALIATITTALAAGLWFSRPTDNGEQLVALEKKLHDAEATIARLNKERSSPGTSRLAGAGFGGDGTISSAPPPPSSLPAATTITTAASASQPAGANALAPPTGKSDKRTAEAEARYADLINQFNLQPEEKQAFVKMLAGRDDIRKDASSKLMDPSLTAAQRQAILAAGKQQLNEVDSNIKQFLNSDGDFQSFQKWQNQELERGQLESGRAVFQNSGVPLSADQESWLVDQMWSLRQDTKGLGDPYYLETMAGVRIDQAYMQNTLNKFDGDTNIMLANARSRMSPQQVEALRSMRVQNRVQLESRLYNLGRTTGGQ